MPEERGTNRRCNNYDAMDRRPDLNGWYNKSDVPAERVCMLVRLLPQLYHEGETRSTQVDRKNQEELWGVAN